MSRALIKSNFNLLPQEYRFDIQKYIIIRWILLLSIFNLILIFGVYTLLNFEKRELKRLTTDKKNVLLKLQGLNSNFIKYNEEYKKLLKSIGDTEEKKKLFSLNYSIKNSPFVSIISIGKSLLNGIEIVDLNYNNGVFVMIGSAESPQKYYDFYLNLKNNNNIEDVEFFYVEQNDKTGLISFKFEIKVKNLSDEKI